MIKECQNRPHFVLVTQDHELSELCSRVAQKSVIALDTEFVRVSSYRPKLGLIQVYDGEQVYLIDPLQMTDFSPFVDLLKNHHVIKVLHACSEDLVVFLQYFNQLPEPMLDTQIMVRFLGQPQATGLATLILQYLSVEIDKGATRTNWLKRPLSDIQLQYAAADVWYLLPLYWRLAEELQATPWSAAAREDCALALQKACKMQEKDPETAYLDIPNAWKLTPPELARLKLLAKWRLILGQTRDLALPLIVKSENLWKAARYNPKNSSEMLALGFSENEVRIRGKKILQILTQARRIAPNDYPDRIIRVMEDCRYKQAIKLLSEKLKLFTPPGLNSELVASKRSLEELLSWTWLKKQDQSHLPELLQGWRKEIGLRLIDIVNKVE